MKVIDTRFSAIKKIPGVCFDGQTRAVDSEDIRGWGYSNVNQFNTAFRNECKTRDLKASVRLTGPEVPPKGAVITAYKVERETNA